MVVTFTKKAAMDMERRLAELLSATTRHAESSAPSATDAMPEQSAGNKLEEEEGEHARFGNTEPSDARSGDNPGEASQKLLRRVTVGTLHSVCSKIVRALSEELGDLSTVRGCLGGAPNGPNVAGATVLQEGIAAGGAADDRRFRSGNTRDAAQSICLISLSTW